MAYNDDELPNLKPLGVVFLLIKISRSLNLIRSKKFPDPNEGYKGWRPEDSVQMKYEASKRNLYQVEPSLCMSQYKTMTRQEYVDRYGPRDDYYKLPSIFDKVGVADRSEKPRFVPMFKPVLERRGEYSIERTQLTVPESEVKINREIWQKTQPTKGLQRRRLTLNLKDLSNTRCQERRWQSGEQKEI